MKSTGFMYDSDRNNSTGKSSLLHKKSARKKQWTRFCLKTKENSQSRSLKYLEKNVFLLLLKAFDRIVLHVESAPNSSDRLLCHGVRPHAV